MSRKTEHRNRTLDAESTRFAAARLPKNDGAIGWRDRSRFGCRIYANRCKRASEERLAEERFFEAAAKTDLWAEVQAAPDVGSAGRRCGTKDARADLARHKKDPGTEIPGSGVLEREP